MASHGAVLYNGKHISWNNSSSVRSWKIRRLDNNARVWEQNGRSHFRRHLQTLIGFVLGFLMAFLTLICYDNHLVSMSEMNHRHVLATEHYQTGYMAAVTKLAHKVNTSLTVDQLLGKLQKEVRILCMVLTSPDNHERRAQHIRATWGRRCNKLVFLSSITDEELGAVAVVEESEDNYFNLWNKTREGFRHVYDDYMEDFDWFLKADDDTYVVMENLRYMLYRFLPETPIYFGRKLILNDVAYMSGGASYVLSKEAFRRFVEISLLNETLCPPGHSMAAEDVYMGICMASVGVIMGDSHLAIAEDNKPKFFPIDLAAFMDPNWNNTISKWLIDMSPQTIETGLNCCSTYSIAFHYVEPQKLYLYEFFIYHFQLFGRKKPTYKLPAKISTEDAAHVFGSDSPNPKTHLNVKNPHSLYVDDNYI